MLKMGELRSYEDAFSGRRRSLVVWEGGGWVPVEWLSVLLFKEGLYLLVFIGSLLPVSDFASRSLSCHPVLLSSNSSALSVSSVSSMNNDVDEFIVAEKKNSRKEVVGKQRNDLLDCIRSCLDLMQDSLDWNYLKAYYNSDNSKNEDNQEEYDNDVADTGSSLGDPIDWEFESVDPKSKSWLVVAGTF